MNDFLTRPYDYTRAPRTSRAPLVHPRHHHTGDRLVGAGILVLLGVLLGMWLGGGL